MKLSLVFELLLIFVLLAFAASKSVKQKSNKEIQASSNEDKIQEDNSINKYCKCKEAFCKCCRDFALPLVNLNGPGCASLTYLNGDKMAVSLSFGRKVIANRTLSSRKPSPVCMPLPGGISKFCGRVYNIARNGEDFRACLGLELQSKSVVEAAVRVSCFVFGPKGVTSEAADPLPLVPDEKGDDDDDDDEDDEDYVIGDDDDDDDDEEEAELDAINDVESSDYTGFSLLEGDLLGDLFGYEGGEKPNKNKNKKKQAPAPSTTTTTKRPRPNRRPSRRPSTITTPRTPRTTTLRVQRTTTTRPRRPTRRPNRTGRPTRRPTSTASTVAETVSTTTALPSSTLAVSSSTTSAPVIVPVTAKIQAIEEMTQNLGHDTFEPIIAMRPSSTTPKTFDDPGLELSVAHITDQLASMPVIPLNNKPKDPLVSRPPEPVTFQKVETITPKTAYTSVATESPTTEKVDDDMIQIVQTLDSSEEAPEKEKLTVEESRAYFLNRPASEHVLNTAFEIPKRQQRDSILEDLDVLDLTEIGETIGEEIGIFGGKKRNIRDSENSAIKGDKDDYSEYEEVMDTMGDALLMVRNTSGNKHNKKHRGRQNKMMRGEWSHA